MSYLNNRCFFALVNARREVKLNENSLRYLGMFKDDEDDAEAVATANYSDEESQKEDAGIWI